LAKKQKRKQKVGNLLTHSLWVTAKKLKKKHQRVDLENTEKRSRVITVFI